jgi:hypothetical protein
VAEVEDHLYAAVEDARARGLEPAAAEREAVDRFGPPARVARGIRAAHRDVLRPAVTTAWLLGGAAAVTLGVSVALTALLYMIFEDGLAGSFCAHVIADRPTLCGDPLGNQFLAAEGLATLGTGPLALVGLRLARRFTPMRTVRWQPRRRTLAVAAAFAVVALAVLGDPFNNLGVRRFTLYAAPAAMAAAVAAVAAVAAGVALTAWLAPRTAREPAP